jgi:hypothetical protein
MEDGMADKSMTTFIIDCPYCRAKVAAIEEGRAERRGWIEEIAEPYGECVVIGSCPKCSTLLVGTAQQISFKGFEGDEEDDWRDVVRVYPMPSRAFSSQRIPKVVTDSLTEADRSLQAGANIAACVMLGRALEALCRDILDQNEKEEKGQRPAAAAAGKPAKQIMLGVGIKKLRDLKVIDDRLFDWSQQLQAFRNLAAHPEDISISRDDVDDLQVFAHAIVEYVYELAERYDDFKARAEKQKRRKVQQ